ncbi:MAG: response regulator [Paludibacter sp.]|nr:response regulator [Paludibacter sp.]
MKKHSKTVYLKLIFFLIFSLITAEYMFGADKFEFSHLGIKDGLSQITINGLYQDENGTMWIGAKDGLKRYNGYKVESLNFYDVKNWISSSYVPTVCGDRNGHIYVNSDYQIIEYNLRTEKYNIIFNQYSVLTMPSITFNYGINSLWIGLKDSVFSYYNNQLTFQFTLPDKKASISSIRQTSDGSLYVGTKVHGLYHYQLPSGTMKKYIIDTEIITIFEDSKKNIWLGTFNDGLICIEQNGNIKRYQQTANLNSPSIQSNYVRAVGEDDFGNIWVGTSLGLNLIDTKTKEITFVGLYDRNQTGLSNLSVWIIMKDNQGTMWFGTYYGGLDYYNPIKTFTYNDLDFNAGNGYSIISKIVQDKSGKLWLGTEGKGLISYANETKKTEYFTKESNTILSNNVKTLFYEKNQDLLWIGTHLGGFSCMDLTTHKFINYSVDPSNQTKLSETVQSIIFYNDIIYLGTLDGIYYFDIKTNEINRLYSFDNYMYYVNAMLIDKTNKLWIAGNNLCKYDKKANKIKSYKDELTTILKTEKYILTDLYQNKKNEILITTAGYGLLVLNEKTQKFRHFNSFNSSLQSDYLSSVSELSNGKVIVGGIAGFSVLDCETNECHNFNSYNGFPLHSMMPGDIFMGENGDIFMGGVNGFSSFNEKRLFSESLPVSIYFSKLYVNDKPVTASTNAEIIEESIRYTSEIRLNHNQNNMTVEVGTNNFINSEQSQLQYKLEGYNDKWITFIPESPIKFMNLPYGKYPLKVRTVFASERNSGNEISVILVVTPPLWATWYSYLLYFIISVLLVWWIIYFYKSRLLLRTSLEIEHHEKLQIEKSNESKMRFFANISHELRTPLTLITGHLELLINSGVPPLLKNNLNEIHSGAANMSKLINELLDFLKANQNATRLKVRMQNVCIFLTEEFETFKSYAIRKNLNFKLQLPSESKPMIFFDETQLQKVLNNILSNAFKYTSDNGEIILGLIDKTEYVEIFVKDNGIGIPNDMKDKIFERFFQIDNEVNNDITLTGTGIGLSLVDNIVKAHKGTITVESEMNKGSVFTVTLPAGNSHFIGNPKIEIIKTEIQNISEPVIIDFTDEIYEFTEQQKSILQQTPTILIIEDEDSIRQLLIRIFEPIYNVIEASNGDDGIILARQNAPDLILSDIMMPGISGNTLCSLIKSDFETCHIPVILLTALNDIDHKITGLNFGADAYITKPFNVKLLIVECCTILSNRRLLQEKFNKTENISSVNIATNSLDQEFIEKAIKVVENNVLTGRVDVNVLCSELAISRTKLFLKMKGITGQTPHYFIVNVKLKLAARMLRENSELNISDITFNLGFSSLNYFGKSFKDFFGDSPSTYRKKHI